MVICPAHTRDLREAIVHGACICWAWTTRTTTGEMLALQSELLGLGLVSES